MTDSMPVFTIKAQDRFAVQMIAHYQYLCMINGFVDQAVDNFPGAPR